MVQKDSPKKKGSTGSSLAPGGTGMLIIAILLVVVVALVAFILSTSNPAASAAVAPQDCGKAVISYLNANLVQAGSTASLVSVAEKNGVYEITTRYQSQNINLYATRDCTLLFTNSFDLRETTTPTPTTQPPEPVVSARPSVELFVMSFCPYGTQAESAMDPVIGLLGPKANITIRYIASVGGTTVDSISSLHGPAEAKEDLRQLCIARYYPALLWPYLMDFNTNCYPGWQNATALDACRAKTAKKIGIDNGKIETCATGGEGLALLAADEGFTTKYQVTGSPTLLINGQRYSGARTPDAYKLAICSHFDTPPAECGVNLSSQAATASGSCG